MPEPELRDHRITRIAVIRPEWGELHHLHPSADNRTCAIITKGARPPGTPAAVDPKDEGTVRGLLGAPWFQRIAFGDRVMEFDTYDLPHFALSPGGTRFATEERRRDGQPGSLIRVNGKVTHETPIDTVSHVTWLDNDRLAWEGYNEDRDQDSGRRKRPSGGIRTFVNGKETTGEVEFNIVIGEHERLDTIVWERGAGYVVHDDGARESEVPVSHEEWRGHLRCLPPRSQSERPERPTERRLGKNGRGKLVVTYRGREYPPVHVIETRSGISSGFAFSADRSKVAYVAIQRSVIADGADAFFLAPVAATDAVDGWAAQPGIDRGQYDYVPPGRRAIAGLVKVVCFVPSWVGAFLCNPYFGPLHAIAEGSRRWVPVNDGRRWRKGYLHTSDHFYTPQDELVVTVTDVGGKQRVIIDEDEGPPFDAVQNVRFTPSEGCVTYCARRGDEVFRVVVHR